MEMSKKTALKILSLYMLTSCVFLGIVFYGWYAIKKDSILEQNANALSEKMHTLVVSLYEQMQSIQEIPQSTLNLQEFLAQHTQDLEIPFAIINQQGKILYSTIPTLTKTEEVQKILKPQNIVKKSNRRRFDSIVLVDNQMYLLAQRGKFWHFIQQGFKEEQESVYLVVQTSGIQSEIYTLLSVICGSFIAAFLVISVIAYFLVLLSLKPLKEKINHLNAFIKDSTHEINTPLSVILMSIERIKISELTTAEAQKFERIKLAAKTLEQIYQDLLFYTFDEIKDLKLENVALAQLITERLSYFEPFFRKKNITIDFILELEDSVESVILANYSRIVRVVDNLLDNALKYTHNGGAVQIVLGEKFLSITDNGCGIPQKHLEQIFNRYFRANDNQGGFGIGLSLVKQICTLYGITITCESVEGEGSIFKLTWK